MSEAFPQTLHWLVDHRSHYVTADDVARILRINTPLKSHVCKNCKWPSSIGELCMLCCDMAEAVLAQPNLVAEHEIWRQQRLLRRMGLL